ncbi:MAG: glycosyltransferase family 2 protein [candidate division Zixibacteria bacterium]|nr:glycosyltransferase family 2 protein [candidate division Zixibacteria bacterium]
MMERARKIDISVVVPMFNEEENATQTLGRLSFVLDSTNKRWEIIVVDDGSTDKTKSLVEEFSKFNNYVKLISYSPNQGRGKALRIGFQRAQGKIICTTDADLSYDEKYIIRMIKLLNQNHDVDLVIGSPYIEGGKAEGVPFLRLLLSRLGNKILGFAMKGKISTVTGVLRAYRRECIKSLELESDGKEVHLEILSKALSMGYKALEMPATLKVRKKGKSKFRFKATAVSHIIFSFFEKPIILFGLVGLFMLLLGFLGGGYVIYLWQKGALNPNRPLMTLIVLLVVSGIQVLLFGFLGTQLVHLRKEIYKIQRENKNLEEKISNLPAKIEVKEEEPEYLPSGRPIKSPNR